MIPDAINKKSGKLQEKLQKLQEIKIKVRDQLGKNIITEIGLSLIIVNTSLLNFSLYTLILGSCKTPAADVHRFLYPAITAVVHHGSMTLN